MPRFLNAQYRLCILTESHRVPTHPHAQLVFSKPLKDWRAQCRPALDQRHRAKARACRGGRMIGLHITCAPCLVVFASTCVSENCASNPLANERAHISSQLASTCHPGNEHRTVAFHVMSTVIMISRRMRRRGPRGFIKCAMQHCAM